MLSKELLPGWDLLENLALVLQGEHQCFAFQKTI